MENNNNRIDRGILVRAVRNVLGHKLHEEAPKEKVEMGYDAASFETAVRFHLKHKLEECKRNK